MADFTFGQVEATLAVINKIADHKRVAFAGRLKALQKHDLPSRDRPGRGKAGTFTFAQLMQLAAGVELLKFGIPPLRAAQLVTRNWGTLRYSVHLGTYSDAEVKDRAEEHGFDPPPTSWLWLVKDDALADLTEDGSSEYDTYEAIEAVEIEGLQTLLGAMAHISDPTGRRTMVINGTTLTRDVLYQVALGFRFATIEDLRADILADINAFNDLMGELDGIFAGPPLDKVKELKAATRNAVKPSVEIEKQAAEAIERLSPSARALMARFAFARSVFVEATEADDLKDAYELGFFTLHHDEQDRPFVQPSDLGEAALAILRKAHGGDDVSS